MLIGWLGWVCLGWLIVIHAFSLHLLIHLVNLFLWLGVVVVSLRLLLLFCYVLWLSSLFSEAETIGVLRLLFFSLINLFSIVSWFIIWLVQLIHEVLGRCLFDWLLLGSLDPVILEVIFEAISSHEFLKDSLQIIVVGFFIKFQVFAVVHISVEALWQALSQCLN